MLLVIGKSAVAAEKKSRKRKAINANWVLPQMQDFVEATHLALWN